MSVFFLGVAGVGILCAVLLVSRSSRHKAISHAELVKRVKRLP